MSIKQTKTVKNPLTKKIKRAKPFEKMTQHEQRIAIAKDVLAQVKEKRMIAESYVYLDIAPKWNGETYTRFLEDVKVGTELQTISSKKSKLVMFALRERYFFLLSSCLMTVPLPAL